MSLFICKWKKEFGREVKENIRRDICNGFAELTGVEARFFAVCFEDYDEGDFSDQGIGVFVLLYQTEGRSDEFKDRAVTIITEAFCKYTGWGPERVSIMIQDIRKGSVAVNGRIVNRTGPAAEVVKAACDGAE